jgi:hypothetical protein
MKEQNATARTNRREMLKLSGMGVLGGVAAAGLTSKAQAAAAPVNLSYASWIHGHSMQIEFPDRIAWDARRGWGIDLECKPGTDNWFHFAIPTPVIIDDVRMQIDSVLLCFETGSADAFVRDVHVYDGWQLIKEFKDVNLSGAHFLPVRLTVAEPPETAPAVGLGLGISLGVGCGVEAMDHVMRFYAAGCDFVIRPPTQEG